MTRDDHLEQLADYLGGEMSAPDRARFEQTLQADPSLATQAADLQQAIDALHALDLARTPRESSRPRPVFAGVRFGTLLRYAAVIALSFGVGYFARDLNTAPTDPAPTTGRSEAAHETPNNDWALRLAHAYGQNSERSGLARSLAAVAYATR